MAKKDEGPSFAWLYVGLGVAAAVGAGYLAWRYLLDESTKQSIRNTTQVVLRRGQEAANEALDAGSIVARDTITRMRNS